MTVTFFGFPQDLAAGKPLPLMIPIALLGDTRLNRGSYTDWPKGLRFGAGAIGGALTCHVTLTVSPSIVQEASGALLIVAAIQMIVKCRKAEPPSLNTAPTKGAPA